MACFCDEKFYNLFNRKWSGVNMAAWSERNHLVRFSLLLILQLWWAGARAGGGDLEGPPQDLHRLRHQHPGIPLLLHLRRPPSRHRSSQESQPLTDLVIHLVGVLIISRAWTDEHLQPPVNVLKYISHLVDAICWRINIQISHLCFEITQRHSWSWNCPYNRLFW